MDYTGCGFEPTSEVTELAEKVEDAFGRPIPLVHLTTEDEYYEYEATTRMDSHNLAILGGDNFSLYALAHELCHLERYTGGIPVVKTGDPTWVNKIGNPLEHFAIFPKLARMNLEVDPYNRGTEWSWYREKLPNLLRYSGGDPVHWQWNLAAVVWNTKLLKTDTTLHRAVERAVRRASNRALQIGLNIAQAIRECGVETAEKKIEALRKIKQIMGITNSLQLARIEPVRDSADVWFRWVNVRVI